MRDSGSLPRHISLWATENPLLNQPSRFSAKVRLRRVTSSKKPYKPFLKEGILAKKLAQNVLAGYVRQKCESGLLCAREVPAEAQRQADCIVRAWKGVTSFSFAALLRTVLELVLRRPDHRTILSGLSGRISTLEPLVSTVELNCRGLA